MTPTTTLEIEAGLRDKSWFRAMLRYWHPRVTPGLVLLRLVCVEEANDRGDMRFAWNVTYDGGAAANIGISPLFFQLAEHEREVVLVHELLHTTLHPIAQFHDQAPPAERNSLIDRLHIDAHEKVVQTLSRALVDARYSGN